MYEVYQSSLSSAILLSVPTSRKFHRSLPSTSPFSSAFSCIPLQLLSHSFQGNVGNDTHVTTCNINHRFGLVYTESMGLKKTELANSDRPSSHSYYGTFAALHHFNEVKFTFTSNKEKFNFGIPSLHPSSPLLIPRQQAISSWNPRTAVSSANSITFRMSSLIDSNYV
jgi:hypothetical protein